MPHQDRLDLGHHLGRLLRVGAAAGPEVRVGRGHPQVLEEDVRHVRVVVLPRVHEDLFHARNLLQFREDRRDLHEIGARPDDVEDLHGARQLGTPRLARKLCRLFDDASRAPVG